ncbi:MAG: type III-B CRISPR module RAMP protein Cmr1 [Rhodospirillales bacterium]|nr:type III-B CRISPR module RAMP protein Cmr1 [Rhodospirillales bacterium]
MTEVNLQLYDWRLRAETDVWTGDVDGKGDRLITTGLLGSLRWWFEVLVRGLDGSACDPTEETARCPLPRKSPADSDHHCVVCELFGCADWARKFRFDVLEESGAPKERQIRSHETFILRFTPLRPIRHDEWLLIDMTVRLVADYGAIGGKTGLNPPAPDYGIVTILERPPCLAPASLDQLKTYVLRWPKQSPVWASLSNFWFVKRRLECDKFNKVLSAMSSGNRRDQIGRWLQGKRGESKKIFSFKNPARTFGFINRSIQGASYDEYNEIHERLQSVWQDLRHDEFLTGPLIVDRLLPSP